MSYLLTPKRFPHYNRADGPLIEDAGKKMARKRNPVYLYRETQDFSIETREGVLHSPAGSYVAYDPLSGDIWPAAADYVAMHYEDFGGEDDGTL